MSYKEIADLRTAAHDKGRRTVDRAILNNTDLIGVIAEGEFAKAYNLPFNADLGSQGDGGYDFIFHDGRTIDVKATERINGNLLVPSVPRKPLRADIYVLAVVDTKKETADFIGWATHDDVLNAPIKDFGYGYGPTYFVHRFKLRPMIELLQRWDACVL